MTGATGSIGLSGVGTLLARGHRTRALARTMPARGLLPPGAEVVADDGLDQEKLGSARAGVDLAIHLAGLAHVVEPSAGTQERMFEVNTVGTENVVKVAARAGVRRLVLASTISVNSTARGETASQDLPERPRSAYAASKLAAEAVVIAARRQDGALLGVVLRLAAVYGPRMKGNYLKLVWASAQRRFVPVGRGVDRRSLENQEAPAEALELAATHPAAAGAVFNVTDGCRHTTDAIIKAVCAAAGRRSVRGWLPGGSVTLAAGSFDGAARRLGMTTPSLRESARRCTEDLAMDSSRIRRELGFRPRVEFGPDWETTIRELREKVDL